MSYLFRYAIVSLFITGCGFAASAHAAELAECKKAKQRQLQLEKGGGQGASAGKSSRGNRRRAAAELDEWLWKNCRSHARELRELERDRL